MSQENPISEARPSSEPARESTEARLRRRFAWKVGLVVSGLVVLAPGGLLAVLFLLDVKAVFRYLDLDRVTAWLRSVLPEGWGPEDGFELVVATLLNLAVFVLSLVLALFSGIQAGRQGARQGEFSPFRAMVISLTRNSFWAGLWILLAGVLVGVLGSVFLLQSASFPFLFRVLPGLSGMALALVALGLATMIRLDYLLPPRRDPERPAAPGEDEEKARLTGRELLERLRSSPIYRRQVVFDRWLPGEIRTYEEGDGLAPLIERFPRIRGILPHTGIRRLSFDQACAMREILQSEAGRGSRSIDYVLVGWPGSGRTTLANLLSLGAVLHREGAMYCISAESPGHSLDPDASGQKKADRGTRHPSLQLGQWLQAAGLLTQVRVQHAYDDPSAPQDLRLGERPDMIFTDVRMLSDAVLKRVGGEGRELIARLRYVVIDHPDRLPRADLIRLRLAIARLRMTAEMFGRAPTFILLLPHLNNAMEFAKFLLNNEDVPFHKFSAWPDPAHLVGWMPPLELLDPEEQERPVLTRARFVEEAIALMAEIGYISNRLREQEGKKDLRVAVVDAKPLLGPEAREYIRMRIPELLARDLPPDQREQEIHLDWTYLSSREIALGRRSHDDLIVVMGVGGNPAHLLSCLRPALASEGAIFLVGDSSPEDQETLWTLMDEDWTPSRVLERLEIPSFLIPDHSDAVIAHEMAMLFEDFFRRPLPGDRLLEVFPSGITKTLLAEWQQTRRIEEVSVFVATRPGLRPSIRPYWRRQDPTFSGEQFAVPWGCSTRRLLQVRDETAHTRARRRPHLDPAVDHDRVFIDLFPRAMRRYPPATVMVSNLRRWELSREDQEKQRRTAVIEGEIHVVQPEESVAIRVDRRKPRFDSRLLGESPLDLEQPPRFSEEVQREMRKNAIYPFLRPMGGKESLPETVCRLALIDSLALPGVGGATTPDMLVRGGIWQCRIQETLRNLVRTDDRLVEEPAQVIHEDLPHALKIQREFFTVGVSLFLVPSKNANTEGLPLEERAAWHGFARAFEGVLSSRYTNFRDELRVILVPNTPGDERTESTCPDGYRVLIHGLFSEERASRGLGQVLNPDVLGDLLRRVHRRLERCDCDDGCSACCGGLGTIPVHLLPREGFEPQDAVSRKGAYLLTCATLGKKPDWKRFYEGQQRRRQPGEEGEGPSATDAELQRLLDEILGLPDQEGTMRGGLWQELFGEPPRPTGQARDPSTEAPGSTAWMVLRRAFLAPAQWNSAMQENWMGLYRPGTNQIEIRPGMSEDAVRETLIHEYCHNWQYQSQEFDLERLLRSREAAQYFGGKLVIEGHATWADHQFRFSRGLGASYTRGNDGRPWNEYKVGYLLFEGLEKAVGQQGLFAWIRPVPPNGSPPVIRSRNPRLKPGFTLTDLLKALDLHQAARGGRYTNFDVPEDEKPVDRNPASDGVPG